MQETTPYCFCTESQSDQSFVDATLSNANPCKYFTIQKPGQHQAPVTPLPTLSTTIRRSSIRRRPTLHRRSITTPRAGPTIATSRCESAVCATIVSAVHRWTLRTSKVYAVGARCAAGELGDDAGELVLEDGNAFLNDLVGVEAADGFDIVEEAGGYGVVVERLVGVGGAAV